jgi:hypothetical protein
MKQAAEGSKRVAKVPVTEANIRKASTRLLATKLVSTEMSYVRRELGTSATQDELDAKIIAVRALPWDSIVVPD